MGVLICNNVTADRRNWSNENKFPLAAHRRGAAPGGADAARNPLLSDMAAAGRSCFGVWILGFHWRPRVSWGPTCGPSHIGLLLEEAISAVSRPAFTPWAGLTCAGPTEARCLPAPERSLKNRGPGRLRCGPPRLLRPHRDRGRPT